MANEFYTIKKDGRTRTIEVTQEKKDEFLKKYKDNNPTLTHIGDDDFKVDVDTGTVEGKANPPIWEMGGSSPDWHAEGGVGISSG